MACRAHIALQNFKVDLKAVLQLAGVEGTDVRRQSGTLAKFITSQVLLVLEDHQFLEVSFYEMINSLLSTGEVPRRTRVIATNACRCRACTSPRSSTRCCQPSRTAHPTQASAAQCSRTLCSA